MKKSLSCIKTSLGDGSKKALQKVLKNKMKKVPKGVAEIEVSAFHAPVKDAMEYEKGGLMSSITKKMLKK